MNNPKEKAQELIEKFDDAIATGDVLLQKKGARKSALIAVDEILNCKHGWNKKTSYFVNYWQEVRQEIEKL